MQDTRAATGLIERLTIWVADRHENGIGLAESDATPEREVEVLLRFALDAPPAGSLLATALCDLASFPNVPQLFDDVLNDLLAVDVAFQYYQCNDTEGQFRIDGDDVLQFPNVNYSLSGTFESLDFGSHFASEVRGFKLLDQLGPQAYVVLMLLLRDRYFPTVWASLRDTVT